MDTPTPVITCTPATRGRLICVLVGAGGTGARIVPPLAQMLRRHDHLYIIDHDIVEDRNLMRQHFSARDIGSPKAATLWNRYRRDGIEGGAFVSRLAPDNGMTLLTDILGPLRFNASSDMVVFIGAVDNNTARRDLRNLLVQAHPHFGIRNLGWIDVGNETRGGQVIVSLPSWQLTVRRDTEVATNYFKLKGMERAFPQLLRPRPEEAQEESCRDRIDLQTVMVNHMAAAAVINALSWLLLCIPFATAGTFFSTLNSMQPIRLTGVDFTSREILPETTFAQTEGQ